MTTVAAAQAAIRSRLEANFSALPLRWKNETTPLPDTPAGFVLTELVIEDAAIVGYGGGRGANLQRTTGRIESHVLMPINVTVNEGVDDGFTHAEAIAAVFRGFRDADISCFAAQVYPVGQRSEDGNYDLIATTIVDIHFDSIG